MQLWEVGFPTGRITALRADLNNNEGVTVSADMSAMVTVRTSLATSLWVTTIPGGTDARQLPLGTTRYYGVSWTPDGRVLYASTARGTFDIWIADSDGRNERQLTFDDSVERDPVMSPDGQFVYYTSNRAGSFNIWRINADGSLPIQLTFGVDDQYPSCTPDGEAVIYQGYEGRVAGIYRVAREGGQPTRIGTPGANWPSVSPDGRWVACARFDRESTAWKAVRVSLFDEPTNELVSLSLLAVDRFEWQRLRFSSAGDSLHYLGEHGDATQVWSVPVAGGMAVPVTEFPSGTIIAFDVRGDQVVCTRVHPTTDVVLQRSD